MLPFINMVFQVPDIPYKVDAVEKLLHMATSDVPHVLTPLQALLELEGVSFFRGMAQDQDQLVWDDSNDPYRMIEAVASAGQVAPAKMAGHAVRRYVEGTKRVLAEADPMEHPDAALRLDRLRRAVSGNQNIRSVMEVTLSVRRAVLGADEADLALARAIRTSLPVAPVGYAGTPWADPELVRRLGLCTDDMTTRDVTWVEGLSYRVSREGKLTAPQRTRAEGLLRRVGSWKVF